MAFADRIKAWLLSHIRGIFAILRCVKPIISFKGTTIVTRFTDVQEVLSRPDVFGVIYAEKMGKITAGSNFFLGMDDTATYQRDVSNMRVVMPREDVDAIITPMIQRLSHEIVSQSTGKMDVVQELSAPVPARFVRDYMGIAGTTEQDLIQWTTYMFQYLFFPGNPKDVDDTALNYAAQTRAYLDGLIAARKSTYTPKPTMQDEDIIGRCLALQQSGAAGMSDEDIRNNLIGMIIGAVPTTSSCVALVLDYLLDHPDLLSKAQLAASHNDTALLRQFMLESLRFNIFGGLMFRTANEDYTLAAGTFRSVKIKKGQSVLASTQSAMFDGRQLSGPNSFKLDRPLYHYMHFGYGLHTCFGYYINMVQIPIILGSILKCRNLRRAKGKDKMDMRGPFPNHLYVEFDV